MKLRQTHVTFKRLVSIPLGEFDRYFANPTKSAPWSWFDSPFRKPLLVAIVHARLFRHRGGNDKPDMTEIQEAWYGGKGLLSWFETWIKDYNSRLIEAYDLINKELIPTRQYDRALVWCLYVFDITVLAHQMISMVRETEDDEIQSVYYIDTIGLIGILKRLENRMNQCRATFDELLTIDAINRLYVALSDKNIPSGDTIEQFEAELESLTKRDSDVFPDTHTDRLPTGVSPYKPDVEQASLMTEIIGSRGDIDPQITELATSLEILRASSDRDAVVTDNLQERLPPNNVRAIKLILVPGDNAMARQITESYLALLDETVDGVRVYRMNYGELLSKWRGESEKNFEKIMLWMVDKARENATEGRFFDVLWMDDVHVLMSQRSDSGGEDYLNVIKTTMLQIMDVFNKDTRLSRFALLFSTGTEQREIDAAFRRRIDNIYELKRIDKSPVLKELLIKHMLSAVKINVGGNALERLRNVTNVTALKRLVYAYYVHSRFVIGTEFSLVTKDSSLYSLQQLKPYFNLNGNIVRNGNTANNIVQATEKGDGPRLFYRPGEIDARNLPVDYADVTVYVLYTDPTDNEIEDSTQETPFVPVQFGNGVRKPS